MIDTAVVLKRFDEPDEVRTFEKGLFEIVHIGGKTIGRATYQPGWKWSEHVGAALGRQLGCGRRTLRIPSFYGCRKIHEKRLSSRLRNWRIQSKMQKYRNEPGVLS